MSAMGSDSQPDAPTLPLSSDPEGATNTYRWTLIESPKGATAALVDADRKPHSREAEQRATDRRVVRFGREAGSGPGA